MQPDDVVLLYPEGSLTKPNATPIPGVAAAPAPALPPGLPSRPR